MNIGEFMYHYGWKIIIYGYLVPALIYKIFAVLSVADDIKQDIKWSNDRHNYPITTYGDAILTVLIGWIPLFNIYALGVIACSWSYHLWRKTIITNKVEVNFDDITGKTND